MPSYVRPSHILTEFLCRTHNKINAFKTRGQAGTMLSHIIIQYLVMDRITIKLQQVGQLSFLNFWPPIARRPFILQKQNTT